MFPDTLIGFILTGLADNIFLYLYSRSYIFEPSKIGHFFPVFLSRNKRFKC